MKHLITLLLLLGPTSTFAQNEDYHLFRDGVQYLYSDHEDYINFGIKLNGTCDSTYTYLADAYECATEYPSYVVQPAFAGYEVCQELESTTLLMKEDRLVTLYPRGGVGQNWMATIEDTSAIWAVVDSVRLDTTLGLADSVKYISFHAGSIDEPSLNTIRIGKTLGLVTAVHFWEFLDCSEGFALVGLSEPAVGFQYPSATDFFTPDDGQELHFEEKLYAGGPIYYIGDSSYFQYNEYKLHLEEWAVDPSGDSLTYAYRGSKLSYRINTFGDRTPYDSILRDDHLLITTISRAEHHALGQQPGTMSPFFGDGQQQPLLDYRDITNLIALEWSCFGFWRRFGHYYELHGELAQSYSDQFPGNAYVRGIGMSFYRSGNFDVSRARKLVYLKDDTRECGTPYDFTGILARPVSIDALPLDHIISLFPNPVKDVATLRLPSDGSYDVSVSGLHGRLVAEFSGANGDLGLDVQDFSTGVYVVSVVRGGKLLGRRRLVVR